MSERAWNVALAVAALTCAGSWAWHGMNRAAAPDLRAEVYMPGERMPDLPGVTFGAREEPLVLFASSTCPACSDSMPFYRDLARRIRALPSRPFFAVVGFEDERTLGNYLTAQQLRPDAFASVSSAAFKLRRTPTLLRVGPDGVVKNYWIGRVSESRADEIFQTLGLARELPPDF